MISQTISKDKGVTLIELMIVMVIAAILVGGIYTLFMTQQRSYSVQDRVTGIQQDARAALTFLARDIRMAGFVAGAGSGTGFSDDTASFSVPSNPGGDTFTYAIEPRNSNTAPDTLTVVLGIEELGVVQTVAGGLVTLYNLDSNTPFLNAVTNGTALVAFDLRVGRLYSATGVDFGNNQITVPNLTSGEKTIDGRVYWVKAVTYSVNSGVLERNENTGDGPQPLAGDGVTTVVEDLQFAYQVEGDTGWYNDPATDFPAGSSEADIRMVRINIIVKTAVPDPEDTETNFFKPLCEDRAQDTSDPGCRRRVYQTVVKIRNL